MGVELDDVIRSVGGIEGIVNGMDTSEWCPTQDKCLDVKYDEETVAEGKAAAKESLQAVVGLPVDAKAPLFGFIGRLEEQKGVDILLEALPEILGGGSKCQVIVLGTGKPALEQKTEAINTKFPRRGVGIVEFNGPLAHLMTAGCDFMLVPSRFEPCGLIQMHAMQYGTVPVVASTGGLVDTVKDGVTGFHCGKMDSEGLKPQDVAALAKVIKRASAAYGTPAFEEMRAKCIGQELSWQVPAAKWEAVLQDVRAGKPNKGPSNTFSPTPVKNVNKPAEVKKSSILSGQSNPKPRNLGEAVQGATGGNNGSWQGSSGRQATSAANAPRNAAAGPTPPAAGAAAKPSQPATIARKGEKADVSTSKAAAAVKAASAGASKPK
jgi:granule-bound starch synthase